MSATKCQPCYADLAHSEEQPCPLPSHRWAHTYGSELRSQPTRLPRVEGVINAPPGCSIWEREVVVVRLSGTRGATVPTWSGPRPQRRRCRCAEAGLAIPAAQLAVIDDEGHKG